MRVTFDVPHESTPLKQVARMNGCVVDLAILAHLSGCGIEAESAPGAFVAMAPRPRAIGVHPFGIAR